VCVSVFVLCVLFLGATKTRSHPPKKCIFFWCVGFSVFVCVLLCGCVCAFFLPCFGVFFCVFLCLCVSVSVCVLGVLCVYLVCVHVFLCLCLYISLCVCVFFLLLSL